MATNCFYSKIKLAAAQHVLKCFRHIIFSLYQLFYPSGSILKTVNKFIVIKSNTKNFDKSQLKTAKIRAKKTSTVYKAL